MSEYLSSEKLPQFLFSHDRAFQPGEKHVTRVCPEDVLLLMFSGVLRFTEDGVPVEVRGGEYYIQKRGLSQQGQCAVRLSRLLLRAFFGALEQRGRHPQTRPPSCGGAGPHPPSRRGRSAGCAAFGAHQPVLPASHPVCATAALKPLRNGSAESALQQLQYHLKDGASLRPNRRRAARQRELSDPHFPPPVSDHAPPLPDASSSGTG